MLSTDQEEIQLQYHPQLNEFMKQVRKAIVFDVIIQKKNIVT